MGNFSFFDRKTLEGRLFGRLLAAAQAARVSKKIDPIPLSEEEKKVANKIARFLVNNRQVDETLFVIALRMLGKEKLARVVRATKVIEEIAGMKVGPLFGPFWGRETPSRLEAAIEKARSKMVTLKDKDPLLGVEMAIRIWRSLKIAEEFAENQRRYWKEKKTSATPTPAPTTTPTANTNSNHSNQ